MEQAREERLEAIVSAESFCDGSEVEERAVRVEDDGLHDVVPLPTLRSGNGPDGRGPGPGYSARMVPATEERLARNEALFREVNESIEQVAAGFGGSNHQYRFVCECSDIECREQVALTLAEYEWVRADPARFVLAPGHELHPIETVVDREPDHVIVEKQGLAGRIATRLDPRAR